MIWGLSGPIPHLKGGQKREWRTDEKHIRENLKNAEMNWIQFQFVYHKYNMRRPGIEFGHLRPRVSFTSVPNGRKHEVEFTGFKRKISDVMCVRTLSTANPFFGLL